MPTTLYYNPCGDDTGHRHQLTLNAAYDLCDDSDHDTFAQMCADDWHSEHDGFEAEWPRVFSLYRDKTGPAFARFEVDREYTPEFIVTKC